MRASSVLCSIFHFPFSDSPPAALLRFRGQSILSFLTEDSDANQFGREVVQVWNHRRNYFLRFFLSFFLYLVERAPPPPEVRPETRPKTLSRNALAVPRPVPRRPPRGHLRRATPAECVLHGRRQRRRLENHRFRKHVESDFRRPAQRVRRRAGSCTFRSEHHLRGQWRGIAAPRSRHRRWDVQIHRRWKILDTPWVS